MEQVDADSNKKLSPKLSLGLEIIPEFTIYVHIDGMSAKPKSVGEIVDCIIFDAYGIAQTTLTSREVIGLYLVVEK